MKKGKQRMQKRNNFSSNGAPTHTTEPVKQLAQTGAISHL
jgi:hypothetical protein